MINEYNRFTNKEKSLFKQDYFVIIRKTDLSYEVRSRNTKHCWVIVKRYAYDKYPIHLYHKHGSNVEYYHLHWRCYSVKQAVKSIISHDDYVLKNRVGRQNV